MYLVVCILLPIIKILFIFYDLSCLGVGPLFVFYKYISVLLPQELSAVSQSSNLAMLSATKDYSDKLVAQLQQHYSLMSDMTTKLNTIIQQKTE